MFFKKKSRKNEEMCPECKSVISNKFSFCPYCGEGLIDEEQYAQDFGILGKNDLEDEEIIENAFVNSMGITDKIIGTLMNSLMKNLEMQFKEANNAEMKNPPNGIRIRIGPSQPNADHGNMQMNRPLTDKQLEKMSNLPRVEAKSQVRRLSDKVVYELNTLGVESLNDVFVSKLETGYEIKAIGKNKVYVNNFPANLPLKKFALRDKGLTVEFGLA